ncbi:protein DpdD [Actinoplanes palleronii]
MDSWQRFIASFYSGPNTIETKRATVSSLIEQGRQAWLAQPSRPLLLPAELGSWPCWYVICPDRAQATWIRDLIRAAAGSWIDFDGRPIPPDSRKVLDPPVNELLAGTGVAYRFLTARDSVSNEKVLAALTQLGRTLTHRPFRRIELTPHLGRLLTDFSGACAAGAEGLAARSLGLLENDHRISGINRLFLKVQFLAAFERWEELDALPELRDLFNMEDRPALVSDALARRVISGLPESVSTQYFLENAEGALVPSVAAIRSAAGAAYYAFWSLSNGESDSRVTDRLKVSGWIDAARRRSDLAEILAGNAQPVDVSAEPFNTGAVRQALGEGRVDAAVEILQRASPAEDLLPLLLQAFVKGMSEQAFTLLREWKNALGPALVEKHLAQVGQSPASAALDLSLASAVTRIFGGSLPATDREREMEILRGNWLAEVMRPGQLQNVIEVAMELLNSGHESAVELVDALLDLEIDIVRTGQFMVGLEGLRELVITAWVIVDESGQKRRAERVLDLISRTLDAGISPSDYKRIVEDLLGRWEPFLTAAGFSFSLETIEVLAAYRPAGIDVLDTFAAVILSRVSIHDLRRLDRSSIDTAVSLAPEFGLQVPVLEQATFAVADELPAADLQGSVAIYSLMEAATRRARDILIQRFPGLRVVMVSDKVATDALRNAADTSDLLVIADRAATHAATDALRRARGGRPLEYATGKGTASLVDAVLRGAQALSSASP